MAVGYASMLDVMSTLALTTVGLSLAHRWPITCWGGITTESTLHSSTAYRMHCACRWHICLLKANKASRDRCKRLCQDLRLVWASAAGAVPDRARGSRHGRSLQRTYNLIWLCGCWHSNLCQPWNKAVGDVLELLSQSGVRYANTHTTCNTQSCNFSFRCTADEASHSLHRSANVQGTEIRPRTPVNLWLLMLLGGKGFGRLFLHRLLHINVAFTLLTFEWKEVGATWHISIMTAFYWPVRNLMQSPGAAVTGGLMDLSSSP